MKKTNKISKIMLIVASGLLFASCGGNNTSNKSTTASDNTADKVTENTTNTGDNGGTVTPSDGTVSDQNVSKIAVKTNPTKMSYVIGETLDLTGGVLTVTYSTGKTAELSMTDSRVTSTSLNTSVEGTNKSIKITFAKKSTSLKGFEVTPEKYDVTFNTNGGSAIDSVKVIKGKTLTAPTNPIKDGYTFDAWYTDEALTMQYDFDNKVTGPFTLYARWLTAGATTHTVTFDYGYYGALPEKRSQKVENNTKVNAISVTPTRKGYTFSGWQKDGADYDFDTAVTADLNLTAKWTRGEKTTETVKFEAEDINFDGIVGNGLSGTTTGASSIVKMEGFGASQDRYVSYMYKQGNTLKFEIISDVDVDNVTFKASMSQELENYSYNKDIYSIAVNGTGIDYGTISFNNVPAREGDTLKPQTFQEYTIGTISLKKGNNEITFTTANDIEVSGTTMKAHAPLLDYIALTSDAVLEWDNVKGYPVEGNY